VIFNFFLVFLTTKQVWFLLGWTFETI